MQNSSLLHSLIKNDLINAKLVNGLNHLGLDAGIYFLSLADTIFVLLGIEDTKEGDKLFEHYLELRKKAESINLANEHEKLNMLTEEIYCILLTHKK